MTVTAVSHIDTCVSFLSEIGIEVFFAGVQSDSFLPGLSIDEGRLIIDADRLLYPGDILHEAGHIAVVPADERTSLNADAIIRRPNGDAEEMAAIAWSYAAALHLNMDPLVVFHEDGYKGGGRNIVENFAVKRYIGVPMLQWMDMTADEKNPATQNALPYPAMIKWMRD